MATGPILTHRKPGYKKLHFQTGSGLLAMELLQLTPAQLRQAATLQEQILKLKRELESVLGSSGVSIPSPKLHWTQTPAGRARLARALKRSWRKRRGGSKPAASGNGKHWTQTPAGRAKMAKLMQKRWKARKRAASR